jgi:hypothetical protein
MFFTLFSSLRGTDRLGHRRQPQAPVWCVFELTAAESPETENNNLTNSRGPTANFKVVRHTEACTADFDVILFPNVL